jgi:hypothetical protein
MVLVQAYPECKSSIERKMYERQHFDLLMPQLNVYRPCLYEDEKPKLQNPYLADNRYSLREQIKLYNSEMAHINREIQKKIYMENTEGLIEKVKQFFIGNTEGNKLSDCGKLMLFLELNYLSIVKENEKP